MASDPAKPESGHGRNLGPYTRRRLASVSSFLSNLTQMVLILRRLETLARITLFSEFCKVVELIGSWRWTGQNIVPIERIWEGAGVS